MFQAYTMYNGVRLPEIEDNDEDVMAMRSRTTRRHDRRYGQTRAALRATGRMRSSSSSLPLTDLEPTTVRRQTALKYQFLRTMPRDCWHG